MIPHLNRKNKIPWMTNDILDLSDKSRSVKKRRKFDHVAMHNFSEINKEIMRRMKEAKENWITDQWKEIDSGIRTGNSKVAFDTLLRTLNNR